MAIRLRVERAGGDYSGRGMALLDLQAMGKDGISQDDVVEIKGRLGRTILARVGPPVKDGEGKGAIRLDQFLRQGLKSHIGDMVEVKKVEVGEVKRVVLAPMLDVSRLHGVEGYLTQAFAGRRLVVGKNSILYASFPGASLGMSMASGAPFKVLELEPGPGVIGRDTVIELKHFTLAEIEAEAKITFEDVGGLGREIELVRELVEIPLRFPDVYRHLGINPPRGIILYGPPGVGKTHLARALANELNANLLYINGPEIVGTSYGETEKNLRKLFEDAAARTPTIIFIDELDVLSIKRGETGTQADTRMATQFLALLDGIKVTEGIIVIGTTNRIDAVDMSFRRPGRFDREIYIGSPDQKGRLEVLRIHARGMPLSEGAEAFLEEAAYLTLGFVGADLMEVCREAGLNALRRALSLSGKDVDIREMHLSLEKIVVEKEDFQVAITRLRPSAMRETLLAITDVTWEDIGGLPQVKDKLREVIEKPLLYPEVFNAMNLKPAKGVLLYGPPGTGKTLLAKAVARQCKANFIPVKGSEVFSQWVGESEQQLRHIFRVARQVKPSIVFFDQLDAIAPARRAETGGTRVAERVVNQLLAELDGIEPLSGVMVVGATNRIDLLDPALLTPGRFGVHLFVPLSDEEGRREILRLHLKGTPLAPGTDLEGVIKEIACATEGYSGSELEAICQEAKLLAVRSGNYEKAIPVSKDHLLNALDSVAKTRAKIKESQAAKAAG